MVVGVVIDNEGRPICCELWPGSTVDATSVRPVTERLKEYFGVKERFCVVANAGMISRKNTQTLDKAGIDYILGVRMRQVKEVYGDILQRGGRGEG